MLLLYGSHVVPPFPISVQVILKVSGKVHAGDVVVWNASAALEARAASSLLGKVEPEDVALSVHQEDDHLILLDKPGGMSVHPAGVLRAGTLVNALLHHAGMPGMHQGGGAVGSDEEAETSPGSRSESAESEVARSHDEHGDGPAPDLEGPRTPATARPEQPHGRQPQPRRQQRLSRGSRLSASDLAAGIVRPGIVHRLDRGTTGVMVVAKNDAAHVHLADQWVISPSPPAPLPRPPPHIHTRARVPEMSPPKHTRPPFGGFVLSLQV